MIGRFNDAILDTRNGNMREVIAALSTLSSQMDTYRNFIHSDNLREKAHELL